MLQKKISIPSSQILYLKKMTKILFSLRRMYLELSSIAQSIDMFYAQNINSLNVKDGYQKWTIYSENLQTFNCIIYTYVFLTQN